ncbi:MAG: AraC family transcriptional regulator [Spirochaetaceae bacterium]|jgi:AraC-like DNA-binding protein|nr:AraC family transcriptional regulator [Spirochaetaceae bacterium]
MQIYVEKRTPLRHTLQTTIDSLNLPAECNNPLFLPVPRGVSCCDQPLTFDGKFTVESMDYTFNRPASMLYHIQKGFIELVYLESARAINREYGAGEFRIGRGMYVYRNQGRQGEFVFLPDTPVRGIRIQILEEFYQDYLKDHFPFKELDTPYLSSLNNKPYTSPALRFVFGQIQLSMQTGIHLELYYESKIAEMLCLLAEETSYIQTLSKDKRPLSRTDMKAMHLAKDMIDGRISDAPKVTELARLTGRCATKLQNDFKTAFGCTIHDYLQKVRMADALSKMTDTDIPLYEVSREVGFKQPSRFTEIFRRTYGITPSEYRNSLLQS